MIAIYKCRLCGKSVETFHTGINTSERILYSFIMNKPSLQNDIRGTQVYPQVIHHCEDGSRGLADFLGFEIEDLDKEGETNEE